MPVLPDDAEALAEWLSAQRGSRVTLRVPQRGDKTSAAWRPSPATPAQALTQHKLRRAGDLTARSQALERAAGRARPGRARRCASSASTSAMSRAPNVVASMVVFEDGLARKSEYRRFAMRGSGTGDTDWIAEVVRRRFARYLDAQVAVGRARRRGADAEATARPGIDPTTGRPRKFAYPPNLVVVDGGAPQVAAAQAVLDDLGIDDVALFGLAKRLEEVWLPGERVSR